MERRNFLQLAAAASGLPAGVAAAAEDDVPPYRIVTPYKPEGKLGMPGLYPGRVVTVHAAKSIDEVSERVDVPTVKEMIARGMTGLTGDRDARDSWARFFNSSDIVGVKVNCSGAPGAMSMPDIVAEICRNLITVGVKPANIYVCRVGNRCDFVKILDFGLVARHRAPVAEARLTMPDQAVGTPEYMPPEVARGQDVDGRADLYGLGCVAYWLLTGRPVFGGSSFYDIISKHMNAPPDSPSLHAPNPVSPELDQVILRCLAKSPEDRPADARELARMLRGVPISEPWQDEHAAAWWTLHLPVEPKA